MHASSPKLPATPKLTKRAGSDEGESPRADEQHVADRTSLIARKDDKNLALLASMKRKPKKQMADSPNTSENHLSKFLEDTHDSPAKRPSAEKHDELGETVSSDDDDDELSRSYTPSGGPNQLSAKPVAASASAAAVASQDESSSHMGDTTETTGLGRKNRAEIRNFFDGAAVALNAHQSQSFSAADTESSIGGGGGGGGRAGDSFKARPAKTRAEADLSDDDEDVSSPSVSYDDSAASESSVSRHDSLPPSAAATSPRKRAGTAEKTKSKEAARKSASRTALLEEKTELLDDIAALDLHIAKAKRQVELDLEVVILGMELEAKERIWNCLRLAASRK